jgi:hypothetical protein
LTDQDPTYLSSDKTKDYGNILFIRRLKTAKPFVKNRQLGPATTVKMDGTAPQGTVLNIHDVLPKYLNS